MTDRRAEEWRCRWCGGPLDSEGYHASEWADCDIERPGEPTMRQRLALIFDRMASGRSALDD